MFSHSMFVSEALESDKHVFIEKSLPITLDGLEKVVKGLENFKGWVTVGFKRRFTPLALKLNKRLSLAPMNIITSVNAGFIPPEVWAHDIKPGGGRIIVEACHFNQFKQLLDSVEKASGPTIPWEEVLNTSKVTLAAVDSLIEGKWISIK